MLGSWRALYTRIRNLDFILRMINSNWNVSGGWVTDIITFGRFILLYWSLWFVAIIATAHLVLYPFTFPHGPVPHLFFVSLSLLSFVWPLVVCPQELGFYSFLTFCFSGYQTLPQNSGAFESSSQIHPSDCMHCRYSHRLKHKKTVSLLFSLSCLWLLPFKISSLSFR